MTQVMSDPAPQIPLGRSWLDGLVAWVMARRAPWLVMAALWTTHIVLVAGVTSASGAPRDISVFQASQAVYGLVSLAGYGLLTRRAARSFARFLPAVGDRTPEVDRWRQSLTSMPSRMATAAAVAGALLGSVAWFYEPRATAVFEASAPAGVVLLVVNYAFNVAGTLILLVHLLRVSRGVTRLHRLASHVDVFAPDPAHAFAGLTGMAGGLVILLLTYSAVTDPATFENPVWIAMTAWGPVLATLVFLLPLLGMRRRLKNHKRTLLDAASERIRRTGLALEEAADAGDYDKMAKVKTAIDALDQQRQRIRGASTLPWEGRTVRAFGTTMLLPLASWLVTSVLGKALGL